MHAEQKQWQDLLEDIELIEDAQEHYTGTLVIHPKIPDTPVQDDDGNNYLQYDVVDGQQRLTTITILLNEISKEFSKLKGQTRQLAAGIRKKYAVTTKDDDPLPKLTLNRDSGLIENVVTAQYDFSSEDLTILESEQVVTAGTDPKNKKYN